MALTVYGAITKANRANFIIERQDKRIDNLTSAKAILKSQLAVTHNIQPPKTKIEQIIEKLEAAPITTLDFQRICGYTILFTFAEELTAGIKESDLYSHIQSRVKISFETDHGARDALYVALYREGLLLLDGKLASETNRPSLDHCALLGNGIVMYGAISGTKTVTLSPLCRDVMAEIKKRLVAAGK
ncbi:MAG: hypothetical protein HY286_18125 [Planctomycetes bacterium]|nr:hypothetical protein [Planctomycetota bacterium]